MIISIITNKGAKKKIHFKADIKISIKNNTIIESYQKKLIKFIDLILYFLIDNTKFAIKCQAEFL